jgi:hypothetical protein
MSLFGNTMKTRLIQYLTKLGFTIEMATMGVYCKHGNNIIVFKRGRLFKRQLMTVKKQLEFQGYNIKDFDEVIIKHNKKIQENIKMFLFARYLIDNNLIMSCPNDDWWKQQIKYFNENIYPDYVRTGNIKQIKKILQ